ncbi:protein-tyrosine phosphatase-like protein [Auriculariales sp. MPI-PUGE-AT-0066]|nr:protein-tyrosine phosphatase-like protein [Auriculariales sp. MPI-PUGE-AT-0066]
MPVAVPVYSPLQDFARAIDSRVAPPLIVDPFPVRPLAALRLTSVTPSKLAPDLAAPIPAASEFRALSPAELPGLLRQSTLMLDIRPNASYSTARISTALSLSVPSTLLKRPAFSLQKLSTMMRSTSRDRFLTWPSASTIVVYDADTSVLAEGNNVLGLLRKFKAAGFHGEIAWIRGGFTAVWRSARDLVTQAQVSDESESGEDDSPSSSLASTGLLRAQKLPMSAFQQSSTTGAARPAKSIEASSGTVGPSNSLGSPEVYATPGAAAPPATTRVTASNPFFDNIRQNVELAQGVSERISLKLAPEMHARAKDIPFKWLRDIVNRSEDEEAEVLAMQFYKIELGEQRRMQGVMDHHTKNAFATNLNEFPYSISAAIEKGTKNRYRDIYPFEHSRVRLRSGHGSDGSDYINANFIQPLCTKKRYIATQGPLPSTYDDFWMLCWEQNVSVVVMLTRQVEGAHLKCGSYWSQERFGPLRLQPISVHGPNDDNEMEIQRTGGFNFSTPKEETVKKFDPSTSVIERKFWLTHDSHPDAKPRMVTQFQYLGWPDVNVPSDADGLLWLINAVNEAAAQPPSAAAMPKPAPILLHCSAGVGRTGGFIVVDAVLDAIRHELRAQAADVMKVDDPSPSASTSSSSLSLTPPSNSDQPPKLPTGAKGDFVQHLAPAAHPSNHHWSPGHCRLSLLSSHSSATNPRSSNPRVFDSTGVTSASASSATDLYSMRSEDVVMSDKDTHAEEPPSDDSEFMHSDPDGDALATPNVHGSVPLTGGAAYFDAVRPQGRAGSPFAMEVHSSSAFDYAPPRVGSAESPAELHTFDEPVLEILGDMRKQRMSLCQSLRQYVFVHQAIIEGTFALLDEQKSQQEASANSSSPPSPSKGLQEEEALSKRHSLKRKQRTMPDDDAELGRTQRAVVLRR